MDTRVHSGKSRFRVRGNEIKYSLAKDKSGKISKELMVFSENLAAMFPEQTSILFPTPLPPVSLVEIRSS